MALYQQLARLCNGIVLMQVVRISPGSPKFTHVLNDDTVSIFMDSPTFDLRQSPNSIHNAHYH